MESVGGYAYFVSEGTLSADLKFLFFFGSAEISGC